MGSPPLAPMATVSYLALGCDKNRVDLERSLGAIVRAGFSVSSGLEPGFALVINTCGFIDLAKEESVAAIMDAVRDKAAGHYQVVAVVGCLVERYRAELAAEVPEVDLWMGLEHPDQLAAALAALAQKRPRRGKRPALGARPAAAGPSLLAAPASRLLTTPGHYSFLKIADGCNGPCRFCAIPQIRGRLRSAALEDLVGEARCLEAAGVVELNLVAQDVAAWGRDLDPPLELADLIERLLDRTAIPWLRVLYAHPERVTDRLIDLIAGEPRLLGYLDLPLQHVADPVLAAMGRPMKRARMVRLLDRLAARVPNLALRGAFLVGHPGETEADFEALIDFIEEGRFLWASGFVYSPEEGTASARLESRPSREEAEERVARLFEAQREVTARRLAELVGKRLEVLIDEPWAAELEVVEAEDDAGAPAKRSAEAGAAPGPEGARGEAGRWWLGRAGMMAVEVDGVALVRGEAAPGRLVTVAVEASSDYELEGRLEG